MENKLEMTFTWENQKAFKMTAKKYASPPELKTIIECEEDGNLALLWPNIEAVCKLYIQAELEQIGKDMKQP